MCNDCRLAQVIRRFTMVVGNHMGVTPSHMICFPDLWLIFPHKHRMHVNSKAAVRDSRSSMWKNLRTQLTYVDLSCPGMESFTTSSGIMIACAWNPSRVTCIPWMLMIMFTIDNPAEFPEMASQAHLGIFTWTCWCLSPQWAIIPHLVMKNGFRCQDWRIQ